MVPRVTKLDGEPIWFRILYDKGFTVLFGVVALLFGWKMADAHVKYLEKTAQAVEETSAAVREMVDLQKSMNDRLLMIEHCLNDQ